MSCRGNKTVQTKDSLSQQNHKTEQQRSQLEKLPESIQKDSVCDSGKKNQQSSNKNEPQKITILPRTKIKTSANKSQNLQMYDIDKNDSNISLIASDKSNISVAESGGSRSNEDEVSGGGESLDSDKNMDSSDKNVEGNRQLLHQAQHTEHTRRPGRSCQGERSVEVTDSYISQPDSCTRQTDPDKDQTEILERPQPRKRSVPHAAELGTKKVDKIYKETATAELKNISTEKKTTRRKGGLCCGTSSVEVEDSFQPLKEVESKINKVTNGAVQANQSNRAAKMSFSSPQEDDVLKAEQGNMSPAAGSRRNSVKAVRSKRNSSVSLEKIQNSGYEPPKAVPSARKESATPQAVKKKKKDLNTEQDIHLVYASQMASMNTTNTPETYSHAGATSNSQPTVEEESDLLENAEEERKKNKKRAREKKMKEKEHMSPVKFMSDLTDEYKQVQTEVDKILQAPGHEASMRKKSKQQKLRKKDKDKVEDNDDVGDEMESLEKARERMHKLLDDAFSVLSQSRSSMANKVEPARQNADDDNSATKSISRHDQVLQNDVSTQSEKAHTPIEVIRSRKPHEHDALVTWSPYRGYDETALISLPNTETNLGARPAELESTRTAVFEESLPYSLHSNYYATEPAEPIVIKTKNQRLIRPRKERRSKMDVLNLSHQHGHYEQPSLNASSAGQIHFQNPSYDDSLPSRSTAEYLDPYYGLSSYQEVPTLTVIPKLTNENEMNGKISSSRESLADDIVYSDRSAVVNLSHKDGTHTPPVRGENKNVDAVDIIKDSLRPGASPQLLINSLREELQALSSRRTTNDSSLGDPSTHISEITHPDKSRQKRKHRNGVLELKTAYPIDSSEV